MPRIETFVSPSPSIQPNSNCLECKKHCKTVPIYLSHSISLTKIKVSDFHPICSKCQNRSDSLFPRRGKNSLNEFKPPLDSSEIKVLVEKYEVDDYKSVIWECGMILSGFRKVMNEKEEEEEERIRREKIFKRFKIDDDDDVVVVVDDVKEIRKKSRGVERLVREAKENLKKEEIYEKYC